MSKLNNKSREAEPLLTTTTPISQNTNVNNIEYQIPVTAHNSNSTYSSVTKKIESKKVLDCTEHYFIIDPDPQPERSNQN